MLPGSYSNSSGVLKSLGSGLIVILITVMLLPGCRSMQVVQTASERIDTAFPDHPDASILELIEPYRADLEAAMDIEVAILEADLVKEQPESSLGNHIARITYVTAERELDREIDFAIMNYGGLRVPYVNSGALKVSDAYQIMPFDNFIVVLEINGSVVRSILDQIAGYGGWPVFNMAFHIENNRARNIRIKGEPLEDDRIYSMAISDYLADGGDKMEILKQFDKINTGILLRDAIIETWKMTTARGEKVREEKDGRVTSD